MAKRLYVVGLGPGDPRYFTGQARAAPEGAQVLCTGPAMPYTPASPLHTRATVLPPSAASNAQRHGGEDRPVHRGHPGGGGGQGGHLENRPHPGGGLPGADL